MIRTKNDLKIIKDNYGEEMMHLCRELFPSLIDKYPLKLSEIILKNFAPNKYLYHDLKKEFLENSFKDLIYSQMYVEKEPFKEDVTKNPYELLKEVGYTLYKCNDEESIMSFLKYYRNDEKLCTFDGGRLDKCIVYFAVKDGASKLVRSDFTDPRREDEYGTSVISIQFTKDKYKTLSIKNRYNHSVDNPDATFGNDLNRIVPGLEQSFSKYENIKQSNQFKNFFVMEGYIIASDGKYYKYNLEIDGVYYCQNNIIIDNYKPNILPKTTCLLADNYIIDLKNKNITKYGDDSTSSDAFINSIGIISNIKVNNDKKGNVKIVTFETQKNGIVTLKVNDKGSIVSYENNVVTEIGDGFLKDSKHAKVIKLSESLHIGKEFLKYNTDLDYIYLPKVIYIDSCFLKHNRNLQYIYLPNVRIIRDYFLAYNEILKRAYFPEARILEDFFLYSDRYLIELGIPKVLYIGSCCLRENTELNKLSIDSVLRIENECFVKNKKMQIVSASSLISIGNYFFGENETVEIVDFSNVKYIGNSFFENNRRIKVIDFSNVISIGDYFLLNDDSIKICRMKNAKELGKSFLYQGNAIKSISLPNDVKYKDYFLETNENRDNIIKNILRKEESDVKKLVLKNRELRAF